MHFALLNISCASSQKHCENCSIWKRTCWSMTVSPGLLSTQKQKNWMSVLVRRLITEQGPTAEALDQEDIVVDVHLLRDLKVAQHPLNRVPVQQVLLEVVPQHRPVYQPYLILCSGYRLKRLQHQLLLHGNRNQVLLPAHRHPDVVASLHLYRSHHLIVVHPLRRPLRSRQRILCQRAQLRVRPLVHVQEPLLEVRIKFRFLSSRQHRRRLQFAKVVGRSQLQELVLVPLRPAHPLALRRQHLDLRLPAQLLQEEKMQILLPHLLQQLAYSHPYFSLPQLRHPQVQRLKTLTQVLLVALLDHVVQQIVTLVAQGLGWLQPVCGLLFLTHSCFVIKFILMSASTYFEYSQQEFFQLYQYLNNTNSNTQEFEKIFKEIEKATSGFSLSLKKVADRLHEFVSKGTGEDDNIECAYQYLSNFLLQLSQVWQQTSENIRSEIVEPFAQTMSNYRNFNQKLSQEMKDHIKAIHAVSKQITDQQEEYIRLMQNADKCAVQFEKAFENIERAGLNKREDLVRASERQVKLKEIAQEAKEDYRKIVDKGNKKLVEYECNFRDMYNKIAINDEHRIKFNKQTILSLMKKISSSDIFQIYSEKLQLLEQRSQPRTAKDMQGQIQRLLKKSGTEVVVFSSFDHVDYATVKQRSNQVNPQLSDWMIVGDYIQEDQLNKVQQYVIEMLTEKDENNDSFQSRNRTMSTSSTKSNQQFSADFISIKGLMSKQPARQIIYQTISKDIQRQKTKQLSEDSFSELGALFKHIIMVLDANESEIEEIYNFLALSSKIVKQSTLQTLTTQLQKLEIWLNFSKWKQIFELIRFNTNLQKINHEQSQNFIRRGFGFVGKRFVKLAQNLQFQPHQISELEKQQQQKYLILADITNWLSDLNVPAQYGTEVILNLSFADPKLEKSQIENLIHKLEESNTQQFNLSYFSAKAVFRRKNEKLRKLGLNQYQQKLIFCLQKAIAYLSAKDKPEQLLLLSVSLNSHLRSTVEKFHLLWRRLPYSEQTAVKRNQNIRVFLRIDQSGMNYPVKKSEAQQDIQQYEEIITMDVQRSLQIHFEKIPSSKLQSLLRTYAYHNEEVGYCQGMNYLAGYMYLTFEDEEVAYKIFEIAMKNHFFQYFIKDFEMMVRQMSIQKLAFYQYDRLLQIFLPRLYQHFKKQRIDPSYYITAWFITVFTQVFQFSYQSALVNIVWDIFFVQSWKGFYRTVLFLLHYFERELLRLEFDQILHFIGEIIKSDLFLFTSEGELRRQLETRQEVGQMTVKELILSHFKVTHSLLRLLENEFVCFQTGLNQKLKEYSQK